MTSVKQSINGILALAGPALDDDEAFDKFVAPFVPNLAEWAGEDNLPIGEGQAKAMLAEARTAARKKREKNAAKVASAQREKRLKVFEAEVSALNVSDEVSALARKVAADNGTLSVKVAEDGSVSFVVEGIKAKKAGKTGGGRIPDGERSGWLDPEGESILGSLTAWAKATYTDEELREAGCYTPQSNKFRSGVKLAKALGLNADPLGRYDA